MAEHDDIFGRFTAAREQAERDRREKVDSFVERGEHERLREALERLLYGRPRPHPTLALIGGAAQMLLEAYALAQGLPAPIYTSLRRGAFIATGVTASTVGAGWKGGIAPELGDMVRWALPWVPSGISTAGGHLLLGWTGAVVAAVVHDRVCQPSSLAPLGAVNGPPRPKPKLQGVRPGEATADGARPCPPGWDSRAWAAAEARRHPAPGY